MDDLLRVSSLAAEKALAENGDSDLAIVKAVQAALTCIIQCTYNEGLSSREIVDRIKSIAVEDLS